MVVSRKRMETVIEFIASNVERDLSLSVLASVVGVSQHHFAQLFKQMTGLSPHQYVLQTRIDRAKTHLVDLDVSVGAISRLTGFSTQEHFTKVFRRLVGITPSKFRRTVVAIDEQAVATSKNDPNC